MLFKVIGSSLIAISSYLMGQKWAGVLKKRVEDIREFEQVLEQLENEISFYSNILEDAFLKISKNTTPRIRCILEDMSFNLKDKPSNKAWDAAIKNNYKNTYLSGEDLKIILSLSNLLGISDTDGQIYNIKNIITRLKHQESKAEEVRSKNEVLFKNLSVLLGITIIILLL